MTERQIFEPLDVAKVSSFIVENHELAGVLLISLLLPNSVVCEEFAHKFSTPKAAMLQSVFSVRGTVLFGMYRMVILII